MIPCPLCSLPLMATARGVAEPVFCPGCRREVTLVVWPALDRVAFRPALPQAVVAGEAACFSCVDKAATGVCEGCGCYTCPACEAPWFGESLCLTCLHARRELTDAPKFRSRTRLHDNVALMMLVLPIIGIPFYGFFFAVLASPVALFLVIRHRKAPRGLPPRGPFRLILAGALALFLMLSVLAGVGFLGYAIFKTTRVLNEVDTSLEELNASFEAEQSGDEAGEPAEAPAAEGEATPTEEEAP